MHAQGGPASCPPGPLTVELPDAAAHFDELHNTSPLSWQSCEGEEDYLPAAAWGGDKAGPRLQPLVSAKQAYAAAPSDLQQRDDGSGLQQT